jgi:OmpA-OmpF porin, OOP family
MASLLELVQNAVTPDMMRKLGALIGETPTATEAAMRRATPAVLAGVVNNASAPAGAARIDALITEGGWGADTLDNLGAQLTRGSSATSLLSSGAHLLSTLFGSKTDGLTDLIASGSGVQRGSASTILSLAAPIVMSVIGKQMTSRGLGAAGLAAMLSGERGSLLGALPAAVTGLLGLNDMAPARAMTEDTDPASLVTPTASSIGRWWPAALVAVAVLATLFLLSRGRQSDIASMRSETPAASPRQTTAITLPGGARVNVDAGGPVHKLSAYLADTSATEVPKRFVFDDLNFDTGSAQLTADGRRTVDSLLAVLKSYPSVQVSLEGHTDATGEADANKALSEQRADAVKQTLVAGGIAADRVKVEGFGQERPVADNTTDAGRARNRRLELVVLQR